MKCRFVHSTSVCFAILFVSAGSPGLAGASGIVDCTRPFARDADQGTLAETFGAANLGQADIYLGEGITESGTVVFAQDPAKRVEILWHDGAKRLRPRAVIFHDASAWRISAPQTGNGRIGGARIGIGASLADVEAANGTPFMVLGFGWDNGGHAGDWRGGALGRLKGGCSLSLNFEPDANAPPSALEKVNGDVEFLSSDPAMQASKPVIRRMILNWPE